MKRTGNSFSAPSKAATVPATEEKVDAAARLKEWFPNLTPDIIEKLVAYYDELLKFNKSVNLIAASTVKNADAVHIGDSIFACQIIEKAISNAEPIYDFGSGNGCPGIVYAILYPARKVVLVDRDVRKMEFCKHVGSVLKLQNLSVLQKGIEDLPNGSVMNVVARGFAPFSRALLICRKQVAKGGRFFHMKGDGWANELAQMPSQVFSHWGPHLLGQYRLPEVKTDMFVVMTEKLAD